MVYNYFVYIVTNKKEGVLYVGVTNNLKRRIYEHKNNAVRGFSQKYKLHMLVYFEQTSEIYSAIAREKQLKNWKRSWKIALIETDNSAWIDLYNSL